MVNINNIIDEAKLNDILNSLKNPTDVSVDDVLNKALKKQGLSLEEVGLLLNVEAPPLVEKMFQASGRIKQEIYGERLVFFAPLYLSNYCVNDCEYCGFHRRNPALRRKLTLEEVGEQVKILIKMGHKRLLLEFGEDPLFNPIDYVVNVIRIIYNTKCGRGEIRRVNVNIAATSVENYQELKKAGIGTYQLFQETYHRETYEKVHSGPKADYERQLFAHCRAMEAGIDDVGLGALFGLYDYKFETLALVAHSQYLEKTYGVGPHTISVPRFQPASTVDCELPYQVNEAQLLKIISILRLAVPYTGIIISTRESAETRAKSFIVGVSQTSAASVTSPGGYGGGNGAEQFRRQDERSVDEVLMSILKQGFLPSFCTACYRTGRTGAKIMGLIKAGEINELCRPNAILTFKEYLEDYASDGVKSLGDKIIAQYCEQISNAEIKKETAIRLNKIERGERDLYF